MLLSTLSSARPCCRGAVRRDVYCVLRAKASHVAHRATVVRAAAALVDASQDETPAVAAQCPSIAEVARTIVDIVNEGTLVTVCDDGVPLGTYVTYIIDSDGNIVLRLREDALHTANLARDARCSVYIHPQEHPARQLARVTLVGSVQEIVTGEELQQVSERHSALFASAIGVDQPRNNDRFYKLAIDRILYVGGLGSDANAETIPAQSFKEACADPLRKHAARLVKTWNDRRADEVRYIAASAMGMRSDALAESELLWVDRVGAYLRAAEIGHSSKVVRVSFARSVDDERDAVSLLTMASQVAWESEHRS